MAVPGQPLQPAPAPKSNWMMWTAIGCIAIPVVGAVCLAAVIGLAVAVKSVGTGANLPPTIEVASDELVAAFAKDKASAEKMYLGRTLRVSGVVREVSSWTMDRHWAELGVGGEYVFCEAENNAMASTASSVTSLHPGNLAVIEGVCVSKHSSGRVTLNDCRVISTRDIGEK